MLKFLQCLIVSLLMLPVSSFAAKSAGNPKAPKGGTFMEAMISTPETLHPITASDGYSQDVHNYVFDTMLTQNPDTYEYQPGLAKKWEVSKDKLTYTYYLRKNAKWSDGKPVTAEDVKFTYDAIFDPSYGAAHRRSSLSTLDKVVVVDRYTVQFKMKEKHFRNFEVLATYYKIAPKHFYGGNKNKKGSKVLGSGPYTLEKFKRNRYILLKRNPNWWGWTEPHYKGFYNFDEIRFKIIKETAIQLANLSRGDLDFSGLTAEQYEVKAKGGNWGKTVFKVRTQNDAPKGYAFIGWNLKRTLFKDKSVRRALSHLLNRELMNKKFRYGKSYLVRGPWYRKSVYADPNVKTIKFSPKQAGALLKKAGWKDTNKDGVLDKMIDGKRVDFKFTFFNPGKYWEKYLTIFKEDLKKNGIIMDIVMLEWNAFQKKLQERDFDAFVMAWGGGSNEIDPRQLWHSSMSKSGSNYVGFENKRVDELTDKIGQEFNKKKRIKLVREVYRIISDEAPYTFLFSNKYSHYGHSNRVKMLKPTFKYGIGTSSWWSASAK